MTKLRQVSNSWYSVTSQKTWILNCKACSGGGHFRQHSVSDGHCDATPRTLLWRRRHNFLRKQYYTFIIKDDDNFAFPVYTFLFRDNKLGNICTYFVHSIIPLKLGNICTYFVHSIILFNYVFRNKVKILNVCLYTCHKGMRANWSEGLAPLLPNLITKWVDTIKYTCTFTTCVSGGKKFYYQ